MKKPTDKIIHSLKCGCRCTKRKGWVFCSEAKALYQKTFKKNAEGFTDFANMKNYWEHFDK